MSTWPEPMPGCLSGFRVSKAALDELDAAERIHVAAHLARCERCAGRVASERARVAVAADEEVPAALRARPTVVPLKKTRGWAGVAGAFALAAAVMLVAIPPPEGGLIAERAKGDAAIEVAVQRNGALLGDPTSAADTPRLEVGDRLRVKVRRNDGIFANVKARDGGAWVEVFQGVIPEDGWLPIGLVVTAGDPPSLSVFVCRDAESAAAADIGGCRLHTLNLRMR